MAKKTTKKSGMSGAEKVGVGVALTTAAVAAAGAYFLYGSPNAAKNRKKVKGWMLKAKGEVLEALESAKTMTAEEYEVMVDKIAAGYSKLQSASQADIKEFKKEMKDHWNKLAKEAKPKVKKAKKMAKKTMKKVKKVAKK